MSTEISVQRIYLNDNDDGTIVCPDCEKSKIMNLARYKTSHMPIKVKCGCGCLFKIIIESRKFYRKETHLFGEYKNRKTNDTGSIIVDDVSITGLHFTTKIDNNINIGDILDIKFTLDNTLQSEIFKIAIVKRVKEHSIGVEYCDLQAYNKELGFYLMPS
jgi:hypothetical protein